MRVTIKTYTHKYTLERLKGQFGSVNEQCHYTNTFLPFYHSELDSKLPLSLFVIKLKCLLVVRSFFFNFCPRPLV